eukprot:92479-Hanusia_phi.AAC.1
MRMRMRMRMGMRMRMRMRRIRMRRIRMRMRANNFVDTCSARGVPVYHGETQFTLILFHPHQTLPSL